MKITTLMENTTANPRLQCEHGLSLYIETGAHKILFDAGQSSAFWANAEALGIDLSKATLAVLSHGHYDHGGGLRRFLAGNQTAPIYLSPFAASPHHNAAGKDIGLEKGLTEGPRFRFPEPPFALGKGLFLRTLDALPQIESGHKMLENGVWQPEDYRHEQYLLVEEEDRRILFSGCSHKGILQIMEAFQPDILIGGFHFMGITDRDFLTKAAGQLQKYPTTYYTGHCTGQAQFQILKEILGDRLHHLSTGTVVEL